MEATTLIAVLVGILAVVLIRRLWRRRAAVIITPRFGIVAPWGLGRVIPISFHE
jgi:hypothetical protein